MTFFRTHFAAALAPLLMVAAAAVAGMLDDAPTAGTGNQTFLPVGEAFKVRWQWTGPGVATGTYSVAPGYYLYRERIKVLPSQPAALKLGALTLPAGEVKDDPYTGRQQVYHHTFTATQAINVPAGQHGPIEIEAVWQGCAEAGLCYPPVKQVFHLDQAAP